MLREVSEMKYVFVYTLQEFSVGHVDEFLKINDYTL